MACIADDDCIQRINNLLHMTMLSGSWPVVKPNVVLLRQRCVCIYLYKYKICNRSDRYCL